MKSTVPCMHGSMHCVHGEHGWVGGLPLAWPHDGWCISPRPLCTYVLHPGDHVLQGGHRRDLALQPRIGAQLFQEWGQEAGGIAGFGVVRDVGVVVVTCRAGGGMRARATNEELWIGSAWAAVAADVPANAASPPHPPATPTTAGTSSAANSESSLASAPVARASSARTTIVLGCEGRGMAGSKMTCPVAHAIMVANWQRRKSRCGKTHAFGPLACVAR